MESLKKLQQELAGQAQEFDALTKLSHEISSVSPESRVDQHVAGITARYSTITKSLSKHVEKLEKMLKNKDIQGDSIKEFKAWLENSRKQLKEYENPSLAGFEVKASNFKLIMADKENGSVLLEKAIETGEDMFSQIAPNDREKMRAEIRELRDSWENHIDYMNTINKTIDALLLKKTSFEESLNQLLIWLDTAKSKVAASVPILATITDKKSTQQDFKVLQQDISSHEGIFQGLKEKVENVGDSSISAKFEAATKTYEETRVKNQKNLDTASKHVLDHEKLNELMEKHRDMTTYLNIELGVLADTPFDSEDAEKRIRSVDELLEKKTEGDQLLSECQSMLTTVLANTSPEGRVALSSDLQSLTLTWNQFIKDSNDFKDKQEKMSENIGAFRGDIDELMKWIREMDVKVKDQPMRSNVETKGEHLKSLHSLQTTIESKAKDIEAVAKKATQVQGDSELSVQISQMNHKYEILKKNIKDVIQKYDMFVKEHKNFNEQYAAFVEWIEAVLEDLGQFTEIVGDLKILQERRNNIEELEA